MVIVGSGPSLLTNNIEKIKQHNVILLNGTIDLIHSHGIVPNLVTIIDEQFCLNKFILIESIPKNIPLLVSDRAARQLIKMDRNFFDGRIFYLANFDYDYQYAYQTKDFNSQDWLNLHKGFQDGGTVLATALQLLVAKNLVKKIYLLGFDIGNANQARFNETEQNKQPSYLQSHYEERILPFMSSIAAHCQCHGICVMNCSQVSLLPYSIFEYSDYFAKETTLLNR